MSECALHSLRSIKGCKHCFLLLACLVFLSVAATAVYLSNRTVTSRSTRQSIKYSDTRSLLELYLESVAIKEATVVAVYMSESTMAKSNSTVITPLPKLGSETSVDETLEDSVDTSLAGRGRINSSLTPPNYSSLPSYCQLPPGGFKAWKSGLVTVLEPVIPRDCRKLMAGDKAERRKIRAASKVWKNALTHAMFLKQTKDCFWLVRMFRNNLYNTALEQSFPVAFTFVVNSSPQQVFRLLKLLYRPQNTFCIHYDVKTPPSIRQTFDNLAKCFSNIMIASKLEDVIWGYNTIMEAQMNCLRDLHKYRTSQPASMKWRYVINLCGKELPLMTNRELVSHLMALNGSSSVVPRNATEEEMWKRIHFKAVLHKNRSKALTSSVTLEPPPFNIKIYKGSSYNAFSYAFVEFLLTDIRVGIIHKFFMNCKNPEEHFYASVYMMPDVPGGFIGRLDEEKHYFSVARAIWCFNGRQCHFGFYCHGQVLHDICITDSADLPTILKISSDGHLFHNKYFYELDHTVMDCLEERIVSKNMEEYKQECSLQSG